MLIILIGCSVIFLGAIIALGLSRSTLTASTTAAVSTLVGCAIIAYPTAIVLLGGEAEPLFLDWYLPFGAFHVAMDGLSAFFMLPIIILSPITAVYGIGYLKRDKGAGVNYFFFNALVISMILVAISRDGILFLLSWELMALSSFFLVVHHNEQASVRNAGWTYFTATHLGTAALLVVFSIMASKAGTFDFDTWSSIGAKISDVTTIVFALAVLGFGSKAGFFPIHIWLPDAHPAAPSHVSALMSGVMIKLGIYGLIRFMVFLGTPEASWGWTLIFIGSASGILGIISALAQQNLKRLLAYSSVENIGIITIGLGIGFLGISWKLPILSVCGFGGGLFHLLNHSIFKGLLFLGAGAVLHKTETGNMDEMGGLAKKMPWTGFSFLVASAAICALPPLNGFASELLIYLGGVKSISLGTSESLVLSSFVLGGMALIGGLAVACFTKCFGLVFLGEPRTPHAGKATEVSYLMFAPMIVLSALCLVIGIGAPFVVTLLLPGINVIINQPALISETVYAEAFGPLTITAMVSLSLVFLFLFFKLIQKLLLRKRKVEVHGVWDCGYAAPASSMQYTTSSYARPITDMFIPFLRTKRKTPFNLNLFPTEASLKTESQDWSKEILFFPLFKAIAKILTPFRKLQHGRVHVYVVYIAITLVAIMILTLGE